MASFSSLASPVSHRATRTLPGRASCRYRRSTLTKAPRKRTFVNLEMEKGDVLRAVPATASFNAADTAAVQLVVCQGDGNNGNNGGACPTSGRGNNSDGDGYPSGLPVPAWVAAVFLTCSILLNPGAAFSTQLPAAPPADSSKSIPRPVKIVPLRESTLVIPNAGKASGDRITSSSCICYGRCYGIDAKERQAINPRQFHAREALLVQ